VKLRATQVVFARLPQSPRPSGLGFSLAQISIGDKIRTSHVVWDSVLTVITVTANEALWAVEDVNDHGALDEAKQFLRDALAGGAASAKDIKQRKGRRDQRAHAEARPAYHPESQ
jgi:hypothetical protein